MRLDAIYNEFPSNKDCIVHLEKIIWKNEPVCPYCNSKKQTPIKNECRYHCNNCNTTFSVTVGTIFHKTKCDLQKWFLAISLFIAENTMSSRKLANTINVNKNTAWYMLEKIKAEYLRSRELLESILKF